MERTFKEAFAGFARDALDSLGRNPALAEFPLALGEPIYGDIQDQGYLEYMAPGVVVSISYIMATGLTALAFILERRDGLFERSLVAGVDTLQILIAHALTQILVMFVQIMLVLVFTFMVFDIPSRGPFIWVILLLLLQGCTGMAFGKINFEERTHRSDDHHVLTQDNNLSSFSFQAWSCRPPATKKTPP